MSDDIISYSSDKPDLLTGELMQEDQEPEILSLRPEKLSDYVGHGEPRLFGRVPEEGDR